MKMAADSANNIDQNQNLRSTLAVKRQIPYLNDKIPVKRQRANPNELPNVQIRNCWPD